MVLVFPEGWNKSLAPYCPPNAICVRIVERSVHCGSYFYLWEKPPPPPKYT